MQFIGKTVEEAIETGLAELGISEKDAKITVVEEPIKGLFGKVKKDAVVEIEKKAEGLDKAKDFLQKVLDYLDVNAKVTEEDGKLVLITDDSAAAIGRRGEVLDALQTLAGAVANIGSKQYKKVVVDCENYREKREETLISLAKRLEEKATETRREVFLEPMSPYERRIIHTALAESTTVKTSSSGKEPQRFVVITPNDLDENSKPYKMGERNGNGKFGGRDRRGDKGGRNGKFNKRSSHGSGFSEEKRKAPSGFGTYLGNSLKDN